MHPKLWTKSYLLTIVILMCCHMGPLIVLSIISLFAKQLTGSDTYAGMAVSVFCVSSLLSRFISVRALNMFSYKKIMIASVIIMMFSSFSFIYANSYWMLFISRAIQGLGYSITITVMNTYIVKIVHPSLLLEGIGYSTLTSSLSSVIAPTLAYTLLGPKFDRFQLAFVVVLIFSIICLFLMFFLKDIDIGRKIDVGDHEKIDNLNINWRLFLFPLMVYFLCSLANSSTSSFLSLYAISLGFTRIGNYFFINAIGVLFARITMKKIVEKIGTSKSILLCNVIIVICLYCISIVNSLWQLLIIAFPLGFAIGAIAPIINTYIIDNMPASKSGLANALFFAASDLGFIIGATFWGYISSLSSYSNMFFFAALVNTISIILSLLQLKLYPQVQ